jgi:hypothetical protein
VSLSYIDPFGCPEFLVDNVAYRSMVGTDHLRFGFYTQEQDERILRVKLVFPVRYVFEAQAETRLFLTTRQQCMHQRLELVMN